MFCLCGPRNDQIEKTKAQIDKSHGTSLQSNMKYENILYYHNLGKEQNGSLNNNSLQDNQFRTSDSGMILKEYSDFISEYDKNYEEKSQLFSGEEDEEILPLKFEESKTNTDQQRLHHQGDGLLVKIVSINQQVIRKFNDKFNIFIMRILYDVKHYCEVTPLQEVKFVKSLVPNIVTELTYRRVKQDNLLISHDPTGSFLLKHLPSSQKVYYISETPTFQAIIERAVEVMHCEKKIQYVVKSEIVEKVDTAIVNLLLFHEIPITGIVQEYLTLSHDLILILSPRVDYHEILSQLRQGIKTSTQSHIYCSIEIQYVYEQDKLLAYIIYFGEISQINQNQQLKFLYSCLSKNVKKTFKYKGFLKNLRSQIGIMKLVDLFALYGLLFDDSDENFKKFYSSVKRQYFPQIKSQRFIAYQAESNKSSTESENDDITQIESANSLITQIKVYSKSESAHALKYEYIHFHSQNNQTRKSKHQDKSFEIQQPILK